MSLATYNAKRHFGKTSEPEGKRLATGKQRPLVFVVQKHQASHLHYDFRLEVDGVLKSWAVPKGPSLNPADRRLARMVEDHPFDYRTFEGTIPAGEYGAGTVMVWDQGPYAASGTADRANSEKQMRAGLEKGHLRFVLDGSKLKGEFSLVRMHGADDGNWLLIKKQDEYAEKEDVLAQDTSAATGRDLEGIANKLKPKRKPKTAVAAKSTSATKPKSAAVKKNASKLTGQADPLPRDVKPMMATLVDEPFERPGWLFELKFDGYRAIAELRDKAVRLYSRRNQTVNERYGPVVEALQQIEGDAVLDGEVTVVDAAGHTKFELLQNYHRSDEGSLVYYLFDLLYYAGLNLMQRPLRERKALLKQMLPQSPYLRYSEHSEDGIGLYKAAHKEHLEGIIAKDGDSLYEPGTRSLSWLKVKSVLQQEAVIGGFTMPRRSRKLFGALVLGVYEGDELVYIGHTGGGFDQKELKRVHDLLQPLVTDKSPFKRPPHTNTPVTWVKPKLVVEVKFSEWTKEQIMRQPIYLGMRTDKSPREVTREKPKPTRSVAKGAPKRAKPAAAKSGAAEHALKLIPAKKEEKVAPVRVNHKSAHGKPAEVELTHPDKVLWPDEGYTKQDLFDYYNAMAPLILPYLRDRPQSLHRFPNGIGGKAFFQKNVSEHPNWIESVTIPSSSGDPVEYLLCQDKATLLYLANLACIEINPWNARVSDLDRPDWLVIDLDPVGVGFDTVVTVAREVHRVFEQVGAECFCKTSGATGLHIFAPLAARYETELVVEFARLIAYLVYDRIPNLTSVERSPSKRQQCVYLDFLQNSQGQTLAAPYSVRPRPGATVSTPLKWTEVRSSLDPTRFTIRTIQKRLAKVGDLWKGVLGKGNDLEVCLQRLQKLSAKQKR